MLNKYVIKKGKKLRYGYTTGSCAAGAAKAAVEILFTNNITHSVRVDTPKGWLLDLKIEDVNITDDAVKCCIVKDAGDDPDNTNGIRIYAKAKKIHGNNIEVTGGEGIGSVTRKGLSVDAGKSAINPAPMEMILKEVNKVKPCNAGVSIEISAPEGVTIAKKTFNPKIGIVGGISILGTTGIVEPMSDESMKESLALKISLFKEQGQATIVFAPGNYGERFAVDHLNIPVDKISITSNYIGYMLEQAAYYEIKKILLVGHIGKLIKVAGGIFNTHSRTADARLEILASNFGYISGNSDNIKKIMDCVTTEEALDYINDEKFYNYIANKISRKCVEHAHEAFTLETVIFSQQKGLLGMSNGAEDIIDILKVNK